MEMKHQGGLVRIIPALERVRDPGNLGSSWAILRFQYTAP